MFSQAVQADLEAAKSGGGICRDGAVWCPWLCLGTYQMWKESQSSWMPPGIWPLHAGCELARGKGRPSRIWDGVPGNLKHHVVANWEEVTVLSFSGGITVHHSPWDNRLWVPTVRCSVAALMCTEATSQILGEMSLTKNQKEAERTTQKSFTSSWTHWSMDTFTCSHINSLEKGVRTFALSD